MNSNEDSAYALGDSPAGSDHERSLVHSLVLEHAKELKQIRRSQTFFRIIIFLYLAGLSVFFWMGLQPVGDDDQIAETVSMADLKATEQRSKPLHEVGQSTANEIQIDNYQDAIMLAVHNHWRLPPNVDRSMQPTVQIELNPDGDLRRARVINSSGNRALDESAIDAIAGVGRFGVPDDIILFERHFRRFNVTFTPEF